MATKWTIGILTIPPRVKQLRELLDVLEPQLTPEIQVIVLYNNFDKTIGELRQQVIEQAKGEYVSFIDDDDLVVNDFIETVLPHLNGKNDYVGYQIAFYHDDKKMKPVYHSLKYKNWEEDESSYYRDISHLNPVRTKYAKEVQFIGQIGEDVGWANRLRGRLKKEAYIDRELYIYRHSSTESRANGPLPGDMERDRNFNHEEIINA